MEKVQENPKINRKMTQQRPRYPPTAFIVFSNPHVEREGGWRGCGTEDSRHVIVAKAAEGSGSNKDRPGEEMRREELKELHVSREDGPVDAGIRRVRGKLGLIQKEKLSIKRESLV